MSLGQLIRDPDELSVVVDEMPPIALLRGSPGHWRSAVVWVRTLVSGPLLHVDLETSLVRVRCVEACWKTGVRGLVTGGRDGPIHWQSWQPADERGTADYLLLHDPASRATHAIGVRMGAAAMARWFIDSGRIRLSLDTRCGGIGMYSGQEVVSLATVVARDGDGGERPTESARHICSMMSAAIVGGPHEPMPTLGVMPALDIGGPDSTRLPDLARRACDWASGYPQRPTIFLQERQLPGEQETARLLEEIHAAGAAAGVTWRPLEARADVPDDLLQPGRSGRRVLDPSLPEAMQDIVETAARWRALGFDLIEHDATAVDLLDMADGCGFADGVRSTAMIAAALYRALRTAVPVGLIAARSMSHVVGTSADVARVCDGPASTLTSAADTRACVNALAFAIGSHLAPLPISVGWALGDTTDRTQHAWIELLAESGAMVRLRVGSSDLPPARRAALREAIAVARLADRSAEPLDWLGNATPRIWRLHGLTRVFEW